MNDLWITFFLVISSFLGGVGVAGIIAIRYAANTRSTANSITDLQSIVSLQKELGDTILRYTDRSKRQQKTETDPDDEITREALRIVKGVSP